MPDHPVAPEEIPPHHHPDLEVRLGVVEHAASRSESGLTRMADEMAVLRTSLERLGDRLTASIDGLRVSTVASIDGLRVSTTASIDGLRVSTVASIDGLRGSTAASIDGLRGSTAASIEALRISTDAGLCEQRVWAWSAFRWQLGITIAISGALFAMIAHGLKWF